MLIWVWVKVALWYLSQSRKEFWKGKPSIAAQMGDQKKRIQLPQWSVSIVTLSQSDAVTPASSSRSLRLTR